MAWVAAIAAGGATAYNAWQTKKLKEGEAEAYGEAGRRVMAAGTRDYQEAKREKEFIYSRALALSAASGAGVDTPGMVKVLGDLNAEGEYQMFSKLWRAQNDAEGLYFRADAANREADAVWKAGIVNSVISGVSAYATAGGSFGSGATKMPTIASSSGPLMSPIPASSRPKTILELYGG